MIEVIDRNPTYPGRVKLVPVDGQENTFDMVRADAPIEAGTPINKALFESINSDITALNQNISNIISAHASLAEVGSLPAGTEFGIYENGILVPYIKVSGDYGGTGRSAVIRKHIYKMDFLNISGQGTRYAGGYSDTWLNNEFIALLEGRVQDAIAAVAITCTVGNGSNAFETIDRKVFLASITECGITDNAYGVEGSPFPYFNDSERRKALFNGKVEYYWTRTPNRSTSGYMGAIDTQGYRAMMSPSKDQCGIRPVFTLPHDFEVNMSNPSAANVNATAEVI